jgi:hypothetical protein
VEARHVPVVHSPADVRTVDRGLRGSSISIYGVLLAANLSA